MYAYYLRSEYTVIGFLDDDISSHGKLVNGLPVIGSSAELQNLRPEKIDAVFSPIGNNNARAEKLENARNLGFLTPNYVSQGAQVASILNANSGIYILAGSVVMPFVEIGISSMISIGANIAHHTVLGDGNFISTGCNIGAGISIGKNANFGIGSTVMTGVKNIGDNVVVGAGAVVIRDIQSNTIVAGVPAKPLSKNDSANIT